MLEGAWEVEHSPYLIPPIFHPTPGQPFVIQSLWVWVSSSFLDRTEPVSFLRARGEVWEHGESWDLLCHVQGIPPDEADRAAAEAEGTPEHEEVVKDNERRTCLNEVQERFKSVWK